MPGVDSPEVRIMSEDWSLGVPTERRWWCCVIYWASQRERSQIEFPIFARLNLNDNGGLVGRRSTPLMMMMTMWVRKMAEVVAEGMAFVSLWSCPYFYVNTFLSVGMLYLHYMSFSLLIDVVSSPIPSLPSLLSICSADCEEHLLSFN